MSDATTLEEVCEGLGPDELRVLVLVAERLAKGRACYGKLRIESDSRTWRAELREELLDAIVYRAIGDLAGERVATADALTATQVRCTELLEEVRELRGKTAK